MSIPTGIIFLFGLLALLGWLVAEWRSQGRHKSIRIGLGVLGIVATNLGSAHSQDGPLWMHRWLLTAIDRELEESSAPHVRQAINAYDREFGKKHAFMEAALIASEELQEARSARLNERPGLLLPEKPKNRDRSRQ